MPKRRAPLVVLDQQPDTMPEYIGDPNAAGRRFAVVTARFNESVTRPMADAAVDALVRHGALVDDVDVVWVPGAWELVAAARSLASSGRYDALVAIGAVVRGETPHFDFVAGEASRGLMQVVEDFDLPVGFGLLTTDDMAQAEARAGGAHGNKGWDAAMAALEMVDLLDRVGPAPAGGDDDA
jgi:6,7-dimethyl-8-ribityllumazine synthase